MWGWRDFYNLDYRLQVQLYLWAMSRIMGTVAIEGNLFFTDDGHLITVGV